MATKRQNQTLKALKVLEDEFNGADTYKSLIAATKTALVNSEIEQARECSERFMALLAEKENSTYYVNVTKQTAEPKNGGYEIDSLSEWQLLFFAAECLTDFADALTEYQSQMLQKS